MILSCKFTSMMTNVEKFILYPHQKFLGPNILKTSHQLMSSYIVHDDNGDDGIDLYCLRWQGWIHTLLLALETAFFHQFSAHDYL